MVGADPRSSCIVDINKSDSLIDPNSRQATEIFPLASDRYGLVRAIRSGGLLQVRNKH